MGQYVTFHLFKGPDEATFCRSFERAVTGRGGRILWGGSDSSKGVACSITHAGNVHALYIPHGHAEHLVFGDLSAALSIPWIVLNIQDGTYWDCILCRGHDGI